MNRILCGGKHSVSNHAVVLVHQTETECKIKIKIWEPDNKKVSTCVVFKDNRKVCTT